MEYTELFRDFPPVTTADWEARIICDLKGADYKKKLIWNSPEGFSVKPYYREEDLEGLSYQDQLADLIKPDAERNEWLLCQDIFFSGDIKDLGERTERALTRGAQAVNIHFSEEAQPNREVILALLDAFENKTASFRCSGIRKINAFWSLFKEILKEKNYPLEALKGSLGLDPIGEQTLSGSGEDEDLQFKALADILGETVNKDAGLRIIAVNGRYFQDAGSTLVQELAYTLSVAVEYLDKLSEAGIDPAAIAGAMQFNFATGPNYFMEIAKLRAARLLWKQVCDAYQIPDKKQNMAIHSISATWNLTLYDPHVNMLRATSETMSAILGGADSISVLPYDYAYGKTDLFSDRIARNTQIILKEEAYFDKVSDPAAGSYYIESLTNALAQEAWKIFKHIEKSGGYLKAFHDGTIRKSIESVLADRNKNLASRKEGILGTSQFPNFSEFILDQLDQGKLKQDKIVKGNALIPVRVSRGFEEIRLQTEMGGKRPKVYMLKFGPPAWMTARAMFSGNFFACAGYEILDPPGVESVEEGLAQAKEAKADVVVICSSDKLYPSIAPQIVEAMQGEAEIVIAGYPKDDIEQLQQAGIKHFIHVRTNILETLQMFNDILL